MSLILAALLAKTIVPTAELPATGADPCASVDRPQIHSDTPRSVTSADLASLVDIGRSDPHDSESPFGISPDGQQIAFLTRRANAEENEYCQRLIVAPVKGSGEARELDRGGVFIRSDTDLRKFESIMRGTAKVIVPRWSPDGSRVAYLKREGATHQVWVAAQDAERPARAVTDMPDNVDDFRWTSDGKALVVATRPGIRLQAAAIARESRTGFLFGERFAPQMADRPIPIDPVQSEYNTVDISTGRTRPSTPAEIKLINPERPAAAPENARGYVQALNGAAAWREPLNPRRLLSPTGLVMALPDGRRLTCGLRCSATRQAWWSADGRSLHALRKAGWGENRMELLHWKAEDATPQSIMVTDDALIGCELSAGELICAREGITQPRRLVAIDPDTGRERLIHDPNPTFHNIVLGKTQRFEFRNAYGVESHADLILPPGHKSGERHPLVVVQYHSHGFLRGGTGDEFPIQLLAAKGFAVLSFVRPDFVPKTMAAETELEMRTSNRVDWTDRRSVQSSLEIAVDRAIATGTVDNIRMGISGFSDGASTTQWALINSSLFKAAAVGTCCEDILAYPLAAGPTFTRYGREMGYRFFDSGVEEYWKPMSLTLNVDRIDTPVLIQAGDSEYEGSLDVVEIFKHRGKAIELFVMEGEPHVKFQPAHRLAIYERSTEWFQFWLMGIMNCDPAKADQYVRWKAMKGAPKAEKLRCEGGTSDIP